MHDSYCAQVLHVIDLSRLSCPGSHLQQLVVDFCPRSNTPWVFISDAASRTILVYDVARGKGHRVVLPDVVEPQGPRDVLYLSLIRRVDKPSRVYFSYLSSNRCAGKYPVFYFYHYNSFITVYLFYIFLTYAHGSGKQKSKLNYWLVGL